MGQKLNTNDKYWQYKSGALEQGKSRSTEIPSARDSYF